MLSVFCLVFSVVAIFLLKFTQLKRGKIEPNGTPTVTQPAPLRREFVMHNKAPMWNEHSQVSTKLSGLGLKLNLEIKSDLILFA